MERLSASRIVTLYAVLCIVGGPLLAVFSYMLFTFRIFNTLDLFDYVKAYAALACGLLAVITAVKMLSHMRWTRITCAVLCAIATLPLVFLVLALSEALFDVRIFDVWFALGILFLLLAISALAAAVAGIYLFGFNKDIKLLFMPETRQSA